MFNNLLHGDFKMRTFILCLAAIVFMGFANQSYAERQTNGPRHRYYSGNDVYHGFSPSHIQGYYPTYGVLRPGVLRYPTCPTYHNIYPRRSFGFGIYIR